MLLKMSAVLCQLYPYFNNDYRRELLRSKNRGQQPARDGELLQYQSLTGYNRTRQNRAGRHRRKMRQQRVEQQEETPSHNLHERSTRGTRESLPENPLPRCVCERTAGHENRANGG